MSNVCEVNLDVLGLRCPEPLMLIRKKMRELQENQILVVTADDPATQRDVPNLCRHLGYSLIDFTTESPYIYRLSKSS